MAPSDSAAERTVLDALGAALRARPMPSAGAPLALAYSGGLDSSVLLDAAVRMAGAEFCVALHVHHGLSPNADVWAEHCAAQAARLGVRFEAERVTLHGANALGVEASARDARYAALEALCARYGAERLWLAQHADDQAETVLLQLLRGTGLGGLAAMAPVYRAPGSAVVRERPLLSLPRALLERYAAARGLAWIDDESNADTRYARNALLLDVLPALEAHFPAYRDALARTAQHAAAAQTLLDDLAADDLSRAALDGGRSVSRAALLALSDARGANLLRHWMRACGLPSASAARLADMMRQLREAGPTQALRIAHAGQVLRLYRDAVQWVPGDHEQGAPSGGTFPVPIAGPNTAWVESLAARGGGEAAAVGSPARATPPVGHLKWDGQEIWRLPAWRGTYVFHTAQPGHADAVPESLLRDAVLSARSRTGGERLRPRVSGPSRTLKNLYQEQGVPAWLRDGPLLFVGDVLLFAPYLGANRGAGLEPAAGPCRRIEWRPDLQPA